MRIWPQRGAWTTRTGESPAARPGEQQGQALSVPPGAWQGQSRRRGARPVRPEGRRGGRRRRWPRGPGAQRISGAVRGVGAERSAGLTFPGDARSWPALGRSRGLGPPRPSRCLCPGRRPPCLSSLPASCTHTSRLRTGRRGQSHCRPHLLPRSWRER